MASRLLCWLLIPCILLTQVATLPHVHDEIEPTNAAHNARPHFHLHGCGHAHHRFTPCMQDGTCPVCVVPHDELPWDHDADAVYAAETDTSTAERFKLGDSQLFALAFVGWSALTNARCIPVDVRCNVPAKPHCPLYIRHRALLI